MSTHAATTTLTTATQGNHLGGLIAVIVVVLSFTVIGPYFLKCWLFPFTHCHHSSTYRAVRCRRCHGTGKRLRAGRHLINRLRDLRRHR